jgi:hypothetical protein
MSIPNKFHTFVDGQVDAGKITAERLNENWDRLYNMFNPNQVGISDDNIAAVSKILISNRNYTGTNKITGNFEFATFPIVPDGSIAESKINLVNFITKQNLAANLPTNLAYKDANETISGNWSASGNWTISGSWTFNNPISNLVIETVTSLPQTVTNGKLLLYNGELYLGKNNAWKKLVPADELFTQGIISSSNLRNSKDTEEAFSDIEYTKWREFTLNEVSYGVLTFYIEAKVNSGQQATIYFAIDGTKVSDYYTVTNTTYAPSSYTMQTRQNFPVGTKFQIWGKVSGVDQTCYIRYFRLSYDRAIIKLNGVDVAGIMLYSQTPLNMS